MPVCPRPGVYVPRQTERLARAVMQDMRWSAKERHGLATVESLHPGVFMVVRRFRSDLGLFVHLHAVVTAGAFEEGGGEVRFMPASMPTPERLTPEDLLGVGGVVRLRSDELVRTRAGTCTRRRYRSAAQETSAPVVRRRDNIFHPVRSS